MLYFHKNIDLMVFGISFIILIYESLLNNYLGGEIVFYSIFL